MIAIIDYGIGNIRSVEKAFLKINANVKITTNHNTIENSKGIVLPGVGAFKDCIKNLDNLNLVNIILKQIQKGKPFLGICLGLQILFMESEEFGSTKGLGIFSGKVVKFDFSKSIDFTNLKIPHIGWNNVNFVKESPITKGIPDNSYFYFVHSFYVVSEDKNIISAKTDYGIEFTSMIYKDNIFATQFHPEKSQDTGLKLLKGFKEFCDKGL